MDISDEGLENSLDNLIDEEADFLDIETEEKLLEEICNSNKLNKNKIIPKNQTLKKKVENSESKQNFVVESGTKNINQTTMQENSNVKADSTKQNSEKWSPPIRKKRNRKHKWFSRRNTYRRHQNNFEQDHNITTTNYNHNRNSFNNFLTNSLTNNSCISSSNMCRMNMEMNCKNNLNTRPNFLSNFENNQRYFMTDQQSFNKSNELINLIRCSSRANIFSSSNIYRMNMEMNCENNLNTWLNFVNNQGNFMMDQKSFNMSNELINFLSNFVNNQGNFMMDQQLFNMSNELINFLSNFVNNQGNFMMDQQSFNMFNELINLIRCSPLANMGSINRFNIYKLELITKIAAKLFDLIDLIQTAV